MKRLILVLGLVLASGPVLAQTQPPATAAAPSADAADTTGLGRTLLIGAGVVGGVVVADLLLGGSLTAPLLGVTRTATPMFTPTQVQEYRAMGSIIGESIRPATAARDVPARGEMLRVLALGLGGVAGGLTANRLVEP